MYHFLYQGDAEIQHKDERVVLRVLPSDKAALRGLAEAEGEAMAVVVRRLIREAAHRRGLWPRKEPSPELEAQGKLGRRAP